MIFIKKFSIIVILLLSYSCADYKTQKTSKDEVKQYFTSFGFALIYDEKLYSQKIINKKISNNEDIIAMHSLLKRNTPIRIINPKNSKSIETVIIKKAKYPKIFNVAISKKLATTLELDFENPYVEINEIKKNKKFIAKKSDMFDDEKNVAEKAPVDEVTMDTLLDNSLEKKKKEKFKNYTLAISDFYYFQSANSLKMT